MRLELSTEEQIERERQRHLADLDKRRRLREELQQAQRDDFTQFQIRQKENRQLEEYQLQQVGASFKRPLLSDSRVCGCLRLCVCLSLCVSVCK